MGYFPNGTSGMSYEEEYCCKCLHRHGSPPDPEFGMCPIWLAHQLYNYEGIGEEDEVKQPSVRHVLDMLIPRTKDKLWNEQCAMFMLDPHWNQLKMDL